MTERPFPALSRGSWRVRVFVHSAPGAPGPAPAIRAERLCPAVKSLAAACLLLLSGCSRTPAPVQPHSIHPPINSTMAGAGATAALEKDCVGSAVCATCHPTEGRLYAASRHAITMTPGTVAGLGNRTPPTGPVPDSSIVLQNEAGRLMARLSHGPAAPLYLALGSGKTGMTYTILQGSSLLEVRKSYFPHLHRWLTTPGQELSPPGELGHLHPYTESRDCLSCHATALPAKGLLVQPRFYNVGCESCHGPGKAHVKAMQAKNYTDVQMADLGALDATHLNDLCGKCHRTAAAVGNNVVQQEQTNRFQPYGLMLSRCFRESGNRLSCLTCHDPHSNASTNMKTYEAACLSCHVPEDGSSSAQGRGSAHATPRGQAHPGASHPMGKPCPLSPHTGCISCHMPARPVMAGIPITMNDHDIRVFVSGAGL